MNVISKTQDSDIATVYIARNDSGKMIEFVESTQPPLTIEQKWVLIVSTLFGCPVDCVFCDAGGRYQGKMSAEEILFQIDYPIRQRFPDGKIRTGKFKVQFSRMGEPSFNPAVLDVLETLPEQYTWNEFIPSLSTIAPAGTNSFFSRLLELKKKRFDRDFQLQFSVHSTSEEQRQQWMPVKKWDFEAISAYGSQFFSPAGKKVTLNFAISSESIIDEQVLLRYFSPEKFLIKQTPVNPTYKARENGIKSAILHNDPVHEEILYRLRQAGYEVIVSIGELEENQIGSNCGQYVQTYLKSCELLPGAYSDKYI